MYDLIPYVLTDDGDWEQPSEADIFAWETIEDTVWGRIALFFRNRREFDTIQESGTDSVRLSGRMYTDEALGCVDGPMRDHCGYGDMVPSFPKARTAKALMTPKQRRAERKARRAAKRAAA